MNDIVTGRWIWLPSSRTLPNTFVLFRREIELEQVPSVAGGWIGADSRYRLFVNGVRVQWGPAPFDPRHMELDPLDLTPYLRPGLNCVGVEVLWYGHGEGTYPFGKPGLIVDLQLGEDRLGTDAEWKCSIDRAHRPGQFKRSFLRALQEDFDARLHPGGWSEPGFDDSAWLPAMELRTPPDKPPFVGSYSDYLNETWALAPGECTLSKRSIPLLRETDVKPLRLANSGRVQWRRDPRDWFEFRVPESFTIGREGDGAFYTYEFEEEVVGFPYFTIEADEGTTVEVMVQECHDPAAHPWLDSHIYAWSRFTCVAGTNTFECFDYEAAKWVQLHVHGGRGAIRDVGIRRRMYPFGEKPTFSKEPDPLVRGVLEASVNTLLNCAQDICVDGMGRERQQYSGDGSHQLQAIRLLWGERRLPARFLRTFAQGQMLDGVFADSWPAWDRLARLWERNVGGSGWGPLVDHSVGFCFDHYWHWRQADDLEPARENWARLMKFVAYLHTIRDPDGLLKVEDLGQNAVWIDHDAYQQQRHKQCAFNLYASAALTHALAPLAEALGKEPGEFRAFGRELLAATVSKYWDNVTGVFVVNRPWDEEPRLCDRSLATAVLFDQAPRSEACVEALASPPPNMGISYPCNAIWRLQALAKAGRMDVVRDEIRTKWATMRSVVENNAIQEFWEVRPDGTDLMSHCAVGPLVVWLQNQP